MRTTPDSAHGPVDRTLDVIEIVACAGGASIERIARDAALPASTAHRIVRRLVRRGYLANPRKGWYMPGPFLAQLANGASFESQMAETARPFLATLAKAEGLHTHLGVLDGEMVSYLVICSAGTHPIFSSEGCQLEAYCSGIGKVLLAYAPDTQLAHYLDKGDFIALTPRTLTASDALSEELSRIRCQGWAVDDGEIVEDLCCVAVPLRDIHGSVVAALSVSGSRSTMTAARCHRLSAQLQTVALKIQRKAELALNSTPVENS